LDQVKNLTHTSIIQKAWKDFKSPHIHGWVYDLNTGLLKEISTVAPGSEVDSAFRYDF
jgi:carbonic anhydrase